jgi:hypothetical protein
MHFGILAFLYLGLIAFGQFTSQAFGPLALNFLAFWLSTYGL